MKRKILLALVVIIVIVVGGCYTYLQSQKSKEVTDTGLPSPAVSDHTAEPVLSVDGWNACDYPGFGLRVQYPKDWQTSFISNSQGAGAHSVVAKCGEIDTRSILGQISFGPASGTILTAGGMKMTIRDTKNKESDKNAARYSLQSTGTATYNGRQYSIVFETDTSADTRKKILESFDLVP